MSISWAYFGHVTPKEPASGASAGLTLDTKPRNSQHQEHHLGVLWTPNPETASIRSISWAYFGRQTPKQPAIRSISWAYFGHQTAKQPASGASAGRTLDTKPRSSQHHEHQLGVLWTPNPETASIRSISWAYFGHQTRNSQHQEHQLGVLWTPNPATASIMSISCAYFGHQTPKQPAS